MPSAPTVTLYTFTCAADLGEDRWKDPGLPSVFYEDREEARRSLLEARDELASDPDSSFPLYLEKVETVPMTRSAIIALLNHGVEVIISNYEVIEEVARGRLREIWTIGGLVPNRQCSRGASESHN